MGKRKWFKKVLDERQELEMIRIERVGFWVLFFGLAASIIVQNVYMNAPGAQYMAELILMFAGAVVILVGCIRKGMWSYYSRPGLKSYLLTSLAAAVLVGLIYGPRLGFLASAVISVGVFALTFGVSAVLGTLTKISKQHQEERFVEDED